jgi:hypothetical protein
MVGFPKKFSKKKRIKVSYFRFVDLLTNNNVPAGYWQTKEIIESLQHTHGMKLTSKRVGLLYFQIIDPVKFSLFLLQYSESIISC